MRQGQVTRYQYNAQNQLVEVNVGGVVTRYAYDALGRRISKESEIGRTNFYWNGDVLLGEVNSGFDQEKNRPSRTYLFEPFSFKPLALVQHGEVFHYHTDHIGTPREITNARAQVVWSSAFKTYGALALAHVNEVGNPLRFQGQYFDTETGPHYNRHRYYDPNCGQSTTQDPIGLLGGMNAYQYAPNPMTWVDPSGLLCKEKFRTAPRSSYEGRMHRLEKPGQEGTTWEAGAWNENASHRYSEPGLGAVYGGTTKRTALEKVKHYDNKVGYDSNLRKYKYKDVKIDNVLDLTDPTVRDHLGVSLEDLTRTGAGQYDITHEIGRNAQEIGYKGIVVPSARNPVGANVIVFGGF